MNNFFFCLISILYKMLLEYIFVGVNITAKIINILKIVQSSLHNFAFYGNV